MCGIFCIFTDNCDSNSLKALLETFETCKLQLDRRGPDYRCTKTISVENYNFVFAASVLWLQGDDVIQQPIETDNSVFVYNGNLYHESNSNVGSLQSDTEFLLEKLDNSKNIALTLSKVQGPYAFVYFSKRTSKLYFCRDLYGRRSLLIGKKGSKLLLTSVACKKAQIPCIEVPTTGVFCYDLHSKIIELFSWRFRHKNFQEKIKELEEVLGQTVHVNEQHCIAHYKEYTPPTKDDLLCYKQLETVQFEEAFPFLLQNNSWVDKVEILEKLLFAAVRRRTLTQPKFCLNCIANREVCHHALTGILFSGGVDCAVLALLADNFEDANRPIDLLNVSFNNNAPDRITGLETLEELKRLRPSRNWNFVELDVSEAELNLERNSCIADVIYPRNTILDDSLGCAIWFASRGQNGSYKSSCRVLLVGSGADELFGGYTKHRAALKRGGWLGLHESLADDWQNISHRNLARDDRVVSDHGRQLCVPYLDENVVNFAINLNCWEKTFPTNELPQGLGEKILLRSLAYKLGLKNAASFKKRAIQFGSRIANKKENANSVSPRL